MGLVGGLGLVVGLGFVEWGRVGLGGCFGYGWLPESRCFCILLAREKGDPVLRRVRIKDQNLA